MKSPQKKAAQTAANTDPKGLPDSATSSLESKQPIGVRPTYRVNVNILEAAPWNVTEEDPKIFNALVENIRQAGVTENIIVVPVMDDPAEFVMPEAGAEINEGKFRIINGHDRWRAAIACGFEYLNAVIAKDWDDDMQKFQTVRHNVMGKKINSLKFMQLYNQLSEKYSEEVTRQMMMFSDPSELDGMIKRVRAAVSPQMRTELDKKKGEIKTIDDLTTVVSEIFNRCGSTLDRGYMVFSYGSQQHIYVAMSKELQEEVQKLVDRSELENRHISDVFTDALLGDGAVVPSS